MLGQRVKNRYQLAWVVVKRVLDQFRSDNLTDWAAALTYYAILSIFPALIILVSLVGLVGNPASVTHTLTQIVSDIGPASAAQTLKGPIEDVTNNKSSAGILLFAGIIGALWSSSGYIGAFTRASNTLYSVRETRSFLKLRPLQMGATLIIVLIWAVLLLSLVLTGPITSKIGTRLGIGENAVTVWNLIRWPTLFIFITLIITLLYRIALGPTRYSFKKVALGSVFAVLLWLLSSVIFSFYIVHFGSYNKTYGTLGGVVILLLWLWISNTTVLLGASLNAQLDALNKTKRTDLPT